MVIATGVGVALPVGSRVAYHQSLFRDGSFASHSVLAADMVMRVPDGLDFATAASLPCPALTASQTIAKLPPAAGSAVLVTRAGGAVGALLVQLLARAGFEAWATAKRARTRACPRPRRADDNRRNAAEGRSTAAPAGGADGGLFL
ncbi:hypothetical protein EGI20_09385 [Aquitalea sp. S1-19]|nr:hypothetical protein [Aquitalea sp. S1-19]